MERRLINERLEARLKMQRVVEWQFKGSRHKQECRRKYLDVRIV